MHDVHENTISQFHTYIYTLYKWYCINEAMINMEGKITKSVSIPLHLYYLLYKNVQFVDCATVEEIDIV